MSLNKRALRVVQEVLERQRALGVHVKSVLNSTIVDCRDGGFLTGLYIARMCMADLCHLSLRHVDVGDVTLPAVEVFTDRPVEACLLSQLSAWVVRRNGYLGYGSGPARALARKPRSMYERLRYEESSEEAVLVLESTTLPNEDVIKYIAESCSVRTSDLYVVVTTPSSIAGAVQICSRVVETVMYKLYNKGFDLKKIVSCSGLCPIPPVHGDPLISSARCNDAMIYFGKVFIALNSESDEDLDHVCSTSSALSKHFGTSIRELVLRYGEEYLCRADPDVFAPATVIVNNIRTGSLRSFGPPPEELRQYVCYLTS